MSQFQLVDSMLLSINNLFSFLHHAHGFISFLSQDFNVTIILRAFTLPDSKLISKAIFDTTLTIDHFRLLVLAVNQLLYQPVSVSF